MGWLPPRGGGSYGVAPTKGRGIIGAACTMGGGDGQAQWPALRGGLAMRSNPAGAPFDNLRVLSHVEGLTAPSKIEGGNRRAGLP